MAVTASNSRGRAGRDYPPLAFAALVMLLLLGLMPSALNLPQTNPSQTLEYAPVPPEDEQAPPPAGNFSSLGLGGSSSFSGSAAAGEGPGDGGAVGGRAIKAASTKRCVGTPPRQTEDPLSPPCVASFTGDNGGVTYQGVNADEIRILLYVDASGYTDFGTRGFITRPQGELFDLGKPPADPETEPYPSEVGRIWQRYFNERFQTYGRFAHFFVYYASGTSPEARRADAAQSYNLVKPFAVVVHDQPYESGSPYVDVMASKGVLAFGLLGQRSEALFQTYPKLQWGYWPSVERQAEQFSDYLCTKVVGRPVSFGGNDGSPDARLHNGSARRLGLLYSTDSSDVATKAVFGRVVREQLKACGGELVIEVGNPCTGGYSCHYGASYPTENMVAFQQAGVSTIVWAQGFEAGHSNAAAQLGYLPEWVVAGDKSHEDIAAARHQNPTAWDHAVMVANIPLSPPRRLDRCYQAAREADPELSLVDSSIPCRMYEDFRQLFTGIQVAGPRLHPDSINKGFRAIPPHPSGSPEVPACFYRPGDYTCVKDSIAMYWDSEAPNSSSGTTGCYRVPEAGKRYLVGDWPETDAIAERGPNDPCNHWTLGRYLDPSPGPDSPTPQ